MADQNDDRPRFMGGFRFLTGGYRRLAHPEGYLDDVHEQPPFSMESAGPMSDNPSSSPSDATAICAFCQEEVAIDNSQPTFVHVLCRGGGDPFGGPIRQTNPTYGRSPRPESGVRPPTSAPVRGTSKGRRMAALPSSARINEVLRVGAILSIIGFIIVATAWPHTTYDTSQTPVVPTQHGSLGATWFGGFLLGVGQLLVLVGVIAYGVMLGLAANRDLEEAQARLNAQQRD